MRSEKINDDKDRVKALEMRKRAIEIVAETKMTIRKSIDGKHHPKVEQL
jgi:hypothetical protein